jgi:hypothetical protein
VILTGIDPLKLTIFSMALTALSLPVTVVPLLIIMNDPEYLGENVNHWIANAAVLVVSVIACVLALVAIPCSSWEEAEMELGQALLDQQVTDRNGEQMGKVDGVVVELRRGEATPNRALHDWRGHRGRAAAPSLGSVADALAEALGPEAGTAVRNPLEQGEQDRAWT